MNTKQKLHQIKLQQRASRFQEQASSSLTIKAWCTENNISIHTYNYWKHLLKQEYVETALSEQHDIVPLTMHAPDLAVPSTSVAVPLSCQSRDSREMYNTIPISTGDILIQVTPNVSDEYLFRILKAVRHA